MLRAPHLFATTSTTRDHALACLRSSCRHLWCRAWPPPLPWALLTTLGSAPTVRPGELDNRAVCQLCGGQVRRRRRELAGRLHRKARTPARVTARVGRGERGERRWRARRRQGAVQVFAATGLERRQAQASVTAAQPRTVGVAADGLLLLISARRALPLAAELKRACGGQGAKGRAAAGRRRICSRRAGDSERVSSTAPRSGELLLQRPALFLVLQHAVECARVLAAFWQSWCHLHK
jgi:hypothetical protein